jgi:CheY-like chemotaxis protein
MSLIKTILVVDDDKINNYITERLLKKMKIADEVTIVANGEEGVQCLKEHCFKSSMSPELILLDINMPVMNGFEFLEAFNKLDFKNKSAVTIVALSSSVNANDQERMKNLGVRYYVDKPLTEEKVETLLGSFKMNADK